MTLSSYLPAQAYTDSAASSCKRACCSWVALLEPIDSAAYTWVAKCTHGDDAGALVVHRRAPSMVVGCSCLCFPSVTYAEHLWLIQDFSCMPCLQEFIQFSGHPVLKGNSRDQLDWWMALSGPCAAML